MRTAAEQITAVLDGSVGYERGLDTLTVTPAAEADPALFSALQAACARLFDRGWQPGELHRVVGRRGTVPHTQLVTDAVAAHLRRFTPATVDPRWQAQADALGATVWWPADDGYVDRLAARWRVDRVEVLDTVLALLGILRTLPPIELLIPAPGTAAAAARAAAAAAALAGGAAGSRRSAGVDVRLLDRVRALLAKAESTTYPAEAETYTAKAQELIARHSIDEALLAARDGAAAVVPLARRIGVDHPYESEKAALLAAVADANRCHTVWSPELGFSTVFGFDSDIDAVDLLHTSLLVQANRAMSAAEPVGGRASGKAGRARLKTFRQSFLVGFTVRIGERLSQATLSQTTLSQTTEAAAAAVPDPDALPGRPVAAPDLLPVLAARDEQVRETMHRVFPHTVRGRGLRVDSDEGWDSGRAAADRAALHQG